MTPQNIKIMGAGITGLWQAILLRKQGHNVTLIEKSKIPFEDSASQYAGAMLAPFCETENSHPSLKELGLKSLELWEQHYPGFFAQGSLVVARPREIPDFKRFKRQTEGHQHINAQGLRTLEPELVDHYPEALYFSQEAHLDPAQALPKLYDLAIELGCFIKHSFTDHNATASIEFDWTLDCRGLAASDNLKDLRGVRGERIVIKCHELTFSRAIHLVHPRIPIYVVPWPDNKFMIGATVIETESQSPVTVRSALDLLSAAFALHPAFGEAEIVSFDVGIRPAFPDNLPKIVVQGRTLYINGLYRNGFLLAPILAQLTAQYIETGERQAEVFIEDYFER